MTETQRNEAYASLIQLYWAERGYVVHAWIVREGPFIIHGVRSDMLNGLPLEHPLNEGKDSSEFRRQSKL